MMINVPTHWRLSLRRKRKSLGHWCLLFSSFWSPPRAHDCRWCLDWRGIEQSKQLSSLFTTLDQVSILRKIRLEPKGQSSLFLRLKGQKLILVPAAAARSPVCAGIYWGFVSQLCHSAACVVDTQLIHLTRDVCAQVEAGQRTSVKRFKMISAEQMLRKYEPEITRVG